MGFEFKLGGLQRKRDFGLDCGSEVADLGRMLDSYLGFRFVDGEDCGLCKVMDCEERRFG